MLRQIWNKLQCTMHGHPYNTYCTHHEDFLDHFGLGATTLMVVKCSNCNAVLGRTRK